MTALTISQKNIEKINSKNEELDAEIAKLEARKESLADGLASNYTYRNEIAKQNLANAQPTRKQENDELVRARLLLADTKDTLF